MSNVNKIWPETELDFLLRMIKEAAIGELYKKIFTDEENKIMRIQCEAEECRFYDSQYIERCNFEGFINLDDSGLCKCFTEKSKEELLLVTLKQSHSPAFIAALHSFPEVVGVIKVSKDCLNLLVEELKPKKIDKLEYREGCNPMSDTRFKLNELIDAVNELREANQ